MFPSDRLNVLALRKQLLVLRSAQLRFEAVQAGAVVARPVALVETAAVLVRRLSPLIALSSLFLPIGRVRRRLGVVGLAWKWAPRLFRAARAFSGAR